MTVPSHVETPETTLVFYDGRCSVCTRFAQRAVRKDRGRGLVRTIDFRAEPDEPARFGIAPEALESSLHAVDTSGAVHAGPDAVRLTMRSLGSRVVPAITELPIAGRVFAWSYGVFARNRLKWFGTEPREACTDGSCPAHADSLTRPPKRPPSARP